MSSGYTITCRRVGRPLALLLVGLLGLAACDDTSGWRGTSAPAPPTGPAEIAVDRVRLRSPGPEWTLLGENEARALGPAARAGAWSAELGAAALLTTRAADRPLAEAVSALGSRLELARVSIERDAAVELGGHPARRFDLVGEADGIALRYAGLIADLGAERVHWVAWTDNAASCAAGRCLDPVVEALSLERDARARAPAATPAPEISAEALLDVGADYALRAGRYEHYRWQLSWHYGLGRWRATALAAGEADGPSAPAARALVVADHLTLPWRLELGALRLPAPPPASVVDHVRATLALGTATHGPDATSIAGGDGVRLRFSGPAEDGTTERMLTTWADGEVAFWLLLTGPASDARGREAAEAEAAASLLRTPRLVAVETRIDAYVDHRLGFGIVPPTGWLLADRTPPELASRGRLVRWEQGGRWLAVAAVGGIGVDPSAARAAARLLEAAMVRGLEPLVRSACVERAGELGGLEARHLSWRSPLQQVDLVTAAANGAAYALASVDRDAATLEKARPSFRLLGPADAPAPPRTDVPPPGPSP